MEPIFQEERHVFDLQSVVEPDTSASRASARFQLGGGGSVSRLTSLASLRAGSCTEEARRRRSTSQRRSNRCGGALGFKRKREGFEFLIPGSERTRDWDRDKEEEEEERGLEGKRVMRGLGFVGPFWYLTLKCHFIFMTNPQLKGFLWVTFYFNETFTISQIPLLFCK